MWMQLASRAFSTGASANKGLPDKESQDKLQEPLVILPLSSDDDDDEEPAEGLHLANPSMNELMRHLHTANQRPIIVSSELKAQNQAQIGIQRCRLQQQTGNESKPNPVAFMRLVGGLPDPHRHQVGRISLSYFDLPSSVQGICSPVRALSLDDLTHLEGVSPGGPLMWRVHSEGSLITMPGDGNLAQQMAILQPAYEEIMMKASRRTPSQTTSDLAALLSPEQRLTLNSQQFQAPLPPPSHNGNVCYWISLAHLLVVVACLRGSL